MRRLSKIPGAPYDIADKFLSDKNVIAECRSGINEECKKYYKPVEIIKTSE